MDIVMKGSLAIVSAARYGIYVVDCTEPTDPELIHEFHPGGTVYGLMLEGNLLYAATHFSGLSIIDVEDPLDPRIIGGYRGSPVSREVTAMGGSLVVVDSEEGLHILPKYCSEVVSVSPYVFLPESQPILQIHPNPANPRAVITFSVPRQQHAQVVVYDIAGRRVADLFNGLSGPDPMSVIWDGHDTTGRDVASGAYFVLLVGDMVRSTQRVMLVR